jgi:hypothetical protein
VHDVVPVRVVRSTCVTWRMYYRASCVARHQPLSGGEFNRRRMLFDEAVAHLMPARSVTWALAVDRVPAYRAQTTDQAFFALNDGDPGRILQ